MAVEAPYTYFNVVTRPVTYTCKLCPSLSERWLVCCWALALEESNPPLLPNVFHAVVDSGKNVYCHERTRGLLLSFVTLTRQCL